MLVVAQGGGGHAGLAPLLTSRVQAAQQLLRDRQTGAPAPQELWHRPRRRHVPECTCTSSSIGNFRLQTSRPIYREKQVGRSIRVLASNANVGPGSYEGNDECISSEQFVKGSSGDLKSLFAKPPAGVPYLLSIAGVLLGCALVFSVIVYFKEAASLVAAVARSGFTAAFSLIFVSEIGDKTFFIAALLAMQYDKILVLLGSMGALGLMTILSVVIGRIFKSVPSQFQTTLPIGEYAAVALLVFFGLKSIKDAWELPSSVDKNNKDDTELGEFIEAEEIVKEQVAQRLTTPLEIIWKSFSLVFFAEWGDRSMLATIALGAAQSPWGVAGGAIGGHLFATTIAILGGSLLARYISEKLVGFLGGVLFLVFAAATLLGVF